MTQDRGTRRRRSATHGRRASRGHPGRWRDVFPLAAVVLATLALTLVGGAPLTAFGALSLTVTALILLAAVATAPDAGRLSTLPWLSRAALAIVVLVPLAQLVPLPPAMWQALPGQEIRRMVLAAIGRADSWQPLSLASMFTMEAAIACIAFAALVSAMLVLDDRHLRQAGWVLLAIVAIDIAIGTLQVASGGYPVLRESRNQGAMLGFFANKNHMGLFVAASMPLAWFLFDIRRRRGPQWYLFLGWCALAMVALIATNSRSGLAVGLVAAGALSLRLLSRQSARLRVAFLVAAVAAGAIVSFTNPFGALFGRFSEVDDDLRWRFWTQSMPLIRTYWPFGAGAGSFTQLFMVHEQLAWVKPTYVNAVHNDYLQLVIEFGVPGIAAAAIFVAALVRSGVRRAQFVAGGSVGNGIQAGAIILVLFALQSVVDYPLRRVATLPMFAFAVALILRTAMARSQGGGLTAPVTTGRHAAQGSGRGA